MIFVTVGTHEQQFDRLLKEIDRLKQEKVITDDVFIQTGFSAYQPKYANYKKILTRSEMEELIEKSDLIISHGGPSTFMPILTKGKKLIVAPRRKKYNEHVNDHQVEFVNQVKKYYHLEVMIEVEELAGLLDKIEVNTTKPISNNKRFNQNLEAVIEELF